MYEFQFCSLHSNYFYAIPKGISKREKFLPENKTIENSKLYYSRAVL